MLVSLTLLQPIIAMLTFKILATHRLLSFITLCFHTGCLHSVLFQKSVDIWSQWCWKIIYDSVICWSNRTVTFLFVIIDVQFIAIAVAMDKEVLHLHLRYIFSFEVSCFATKFIGWGLKRYKSGCWFFGISGPEKSWIFIQRFEWEPCVEYYSEKEG